MLRGLIFVRVLGVPHGQVEIVFPVASEAMTDTGEQEQGGIRVVPGVSGGFTKTTVARN